MDTAKYDSKLNSVWFMVCIGRQLKLAGWRCSLSCYLPLIQCLAANIVLTAKAGVNSLLKL